MYLYAVAYTLRMSYKTDYKIEGFFEYVVPPLGRILVAGKYTMSVNYADKDLHFNWISVIRLPDFVNQKLILNGLLKQQRKRKN